MIGLGWMILDSRVLLRMEKEEMDSAWVCFWDVLVHWLIVNSIKFISINKRGNKTWFSGKFNTFPSVSYLFAIKHHICTFEVSNSKKPDILKKRSILAKSCCVWYDPGHILQRQQNASTIRYILYRMDQAQKSSVLIEVPLSQIDRVVVS
jgi:hypothetical protein